MQGIDPQSALELAKVRGAELRAEAQRHRLARRAQAHVAGGGLAVDRTAPRLRMRVLSW